MAMYTKGQRIVCPCCDELFDDDCVEDFTTAGEAGPESESVHRCEHCNACFAVTQITEGNFEVAAVEYDAEDED